MPTLYSGTSNRAIRSRRKAPGLRLSSERHAPKPDKRNSNGMSHGSMNPTNASAASLVCGFFRRQGRGSKSRAL